MTRLDDKAAQRAEILRGAARRLRCDGIAASGLRTLMADAGLTHGAFYSHFDSRADLVAASTGAAAAETVERLRRTVSEAPPDGAFSALVDAYLSPLHVRHMDLGCAASALAPEIARLEEDARRPFKAGVDLLVEMIADVLPAGGATAHRLARASAIFGGMLGCLQLARIYAGAPKAEALLEEGRRSAVVLAHGRWELEG